MNIKPYSLNLDIFISKKEFLDFLKKNLTNLKKRSKIFKG